MSYWKDGRRHYTGTEIFYTTNGGSKWKKRKIKTAFDLNSVYFIDVMKGFACGTDCVVLRTIDGENWGHIFGETKHELESVYFTDATTGWIVGEKGTILKTEDGGDLWKWQNNEISDVNEWFLSVNFFDDNTGWVCGSKGVILKTTDGGDTWNEKFNINDLPDWEVANKPEEFLLESIYFINEINGWAVGEDGLILHTTDAGENWVPKESGTNFRLESVYFYDISNGWIVGSIVEERDLNRIILKTDDGGATWNKVDAATKEWLSSVYSPNGSDVYAVGSLGTIVNSSNEGDNWSIVDKTDIDDWRPLWLEDVFFVVDDVSNIYGWAVGGGFHSKRATIFKYPGQSPYEWELQESGMRGECLLSVYFIDRYIGWAVGNKGTIIYTTDGGDSWYKKTSHDVPYSRILDY